MPSEKLRLPPRVRAALRSARKPRTQKEVAHELRLDDGLVGHYETGRYPVPKARFWKMVRALDRSDQDALTWWRMAIQERIADLLTDGGMSENDRTHVVRTIERFWSRAEDEGDPPQAARSA